MSCNDSPAVTAPLMQNQMSDLEALSALNKRFIHNFVTNDVQSHDAILHPHFRAIYSAYFSPSWTAFQVDGGRDFNVVVDGVSV
jgi:hypothetical protein